MKFFNRILFCSVLFCFVHPVKADSGVFKAILTTIGINIVVDKFVPPRCTDKKSLALNFATKFLAQTAFSIFNYRHFDMGAQIGEYEENLAKTVDANQWDAATVQRVKTRLHGYKLICKKLEEKSGFTIKTLHVQNNSFFNAAAQGTPSNGRIFITSSWLTTDKADDATILNYLEGVLAHELGHVALSHTFKNMRWSTVKNAALHYVLYWMTARIGDSYRKDLSSVKNCTYKGLTQSFSGEIFDRFLSGEELLFQDREDRANVRAATKNCYDKLHSADKIIQVINYLSLFEIFASSRFYEYQADAWATRIVPAEQLISALAFLEDQNLALMFPGKSEQELSVIKGNIKNNNILFGFLSTHPAIYKRIARVQKPNISEKSVWFDSSCYAWW